MHFEPIIPPFQRGTFSLPYYDIQRSLNWFLYHYIGPNNPTIDITGVIK